MVIETTTADQTILDKEFAILSDFDSDFTSNFDKSDIAIDSNGLFLNVVDLTALTISFRRMLKPRSLIDFYLHHYLYLRKTS